MTTTQGTNSIWSLLLLTSLFLSQFSIAQKSALEGMTSKARNFETFDSERASNVEAWKKHNDESYYDHPDFGILLENAPCRNCVEDLSKREKDLRHFIDIEDPTRFYIQKAKGLLHHKVNGKWVNIKHKLEEHGPSSYISPFYLNEVQINCNDQSVTIREGIREVSFNNWSLYKTLNDEQIKVSEANWTNYSAGEDGVYVTDIFPGIDAELIIYPGSIKTNFVINEISINNYDALIFKDDINTNGNTELDFIPIPNGQKGVGDIAISSDGRGIAQYGRAVAYPRGGEKSMIEEIPYAVSKNSISMIVPKEWINKYKDQYKLIIDPLVSASNTLAQASITGSEYNASCNFDNSCDQFLTVPAPANATFDDVLWTFTYEAINGAWLNEGAVRFATGGCVSPSQAGFYWFCNLTGGGTCEGTNVSVFSDLGSCLPAPSCSPQNVNFTMQFFRSCWGTAGCNNDYIGAFSPWTMTITGQTIDYTNISNPINVSSTTVCEGGSINVNTSAQDGVPAYTYNWSFDPSGSPSVGSGANTSITFPNSGTVTLYSIVTDNCGQVSTASQVITVNPNPTPTITGDTEYCQGQSASISTGAFSSYSWSNGANTQNTTVTTADNPITVTVTDANGCSGTSAQYNVTENPNPTPTITGSSTYCAGNTAAISTQAGFSNYSWSNGAGTQSTNVTDADNPITVTVTDANGCSGTSAQFNVTEQANITYSETIEICQGQSATIHGNTETTAGTYQQTFTTATCDSIATITLVVNSLPTITASATQNPICDGESTDLSASGGATYSWDNSLGAGAGHTVNPNTTTTFTVIGTDANGCENTDQIEITVNPLPTVDAGSDVTVCDNQDVTLTASGNATSYSWDNGVTDGVSFTPPTGTTTYTVTGTDANGCENTDQVDVSVGSLPTVNAGADFEACEGEMITLTGSGTATTYNWDNGGVDGVPFSATATTTFTVTGTNSAGCSDTDQITVTVNPLPTVDAGPDITICDGEDTTLTASGNADTYTWDNGITDGVSFTPTVGTTTYTVTAENTNTGCTNTDQVDVTVNPNPTVNAGLDTTICEGESLTLSGSGTATTYTWDNGVTDGTPFTPGTGTTTYTVTGTDANGCSATDQIDVNTIPQPVADFSATPMSGAPPLEVDFSNQSSNGTSYDWDFGNGSTASNPSNTDESETYNATGTYEVILVVSNGDCADQSSLFIVVEESPLNYVIPNGFTPNDDGTNDIFHMNISNAESVEIEIFNRWGNMVGKITSLDPSNGWDGNDFSGKPVTDGVYFYTYKIIDLQGEEHTGHQYLHLERNN
tara:strand:- start:16417 stop:20313 length:3897 start_codon:yes stop_codon:yes gene_type:complete